MSKRRMAGAAFLFLFGVLIGLNSLGNTRLGAIHGADRLQLIAVGFCFGLGAGVLLGGNSLRRY